MKTSLLTPRSAIGFLLSVLFLHLVCTAPFPWEPEQGMAALVRVPADAMLILSLGATMTLASGSVRPVAAILALLVLLAPLYRFGTSVVLAFYGKEFDLFNDVVMIPSLLHLLLHKMSQVTQVLTIGGVCLAILLLWYVSWRALRTVLCRGRGFLTGLLILAQALVLVFWMGGGRPEDRRESMIAKSQFASLGAEIGEIVRVGYWRYREAWKQRVEGAIAESASVPTNLAKLRDVDVYLFFVESYGRTFGRREDRRAACDDFRRALAKELKDSGLGTVSGFGAPSLIGGQSALAHAEFLSGVPVENRRVFDLMLSSWLKPLPRHFKAAGFHCVNVHPAMPRSWPEGMRFYGFDQEVFQDVLPYRGRAYPWGGMPDQFALAHVLKSTVSASREKRLFLFFASVTSHAPFSEVPPYFEDWEDALAPGAFDAQPAAVYPLNFGNFAHHEQGMEAYEANIRYSLRAACDFLRKLPRPFLAIVLGDHQPPGLSVALSTDRTSQDVPIHVISPRDDLLRPFLERGFCEGLTPASETESIPFHRFLVRFLADFGNL